MTTTIHPMLEVGDQARAEGRLDDAERAFRAVLVDEPDNFGALYNLGKLLWDRRQPGHAIPLLEEAAHNAPTDMALPLARVLHQLERYEAAEALCRQLLEAGETGADAQVLLGRIQARQGRSEEAAQSWSRALSAEPGHPGASIELARVLLNLHQPGKACRVLEVAREHHPELPALKVQHAAALRETEDHDQALELLASVPESGPAWLTSLARRAEVFLDRGQPEAARAELRRATGEWTPSMQLVEALACADLDLPGEAANRLRDLLARQPDNQQAWQVFCRVSPEAISGPDIKRLKRFRRNSSLGNRVRINFALGTVARSRDDLAGEIKVIERANELQRERLAYRREELEGFHQRLREIFTADWLARHADAGDRDFAPVFLVGLPFSGTRLAEVLLAEQGWPVLGESGMLRTLLREAGRSLGMAQVGDLLADVDADRMAFFVRGARQWLTTKANLDGGGFVERNWNDFQYLPLLRGMFPRARFVQLRRAPKDLIIANYRHHFERGHAYSYNLEDCAHMLGEYERLVRHWRAEPGIEVTDLEFEDLLGEPGAALTRAGLTRGTEPGERGTRALRAWRGTTGLAGRYRDWSARLDESLFRFLPGEK